MSNIITVSIIGVGARGGEAYGRYMSTLKDKYSIVALCDVNPVKLKKYGDTFGVAEENRFLDEEEFFKEKRSDLLLVTTQDRLHIRMAKKALLLGYDILLEKPVSDDAQELKELNELAKKTGRKVLVCHVLRYTVMIRKLKQLLDEGAIGKLISIDQTENVVYWHEAHSYVRGNWRKRADATPMIMAKCCHDLDLLQYFAGSECLSVASMGDLTYFKKENHPEGAAERCTQCKYVDTCQYSAKRIYIEMWKNADCPENIFPFNLITDAYPLTEEALLQSIENTNYGKCVFCCDNDVVDHQTTIMQFKNGVTATLKMEAFVKYGGRDIRFFGSEGELELRENEQTITLKRYFEEDKVWRIPEMVDELGGKGAGDHGGGDQRMIKALYEILTGEKFYPETALEKSIESHYMALAAEESRLDGGRLVLLEKYK